MENIVKDKYRLRRLLPSQWEDYKLIRLEALKTNPEMFGSNYAKEVAQIRNDRRNVSLGPSLKSHFSIMIGSCRKLHSPDLPRIC